MKCLPLIPLIQSIYPDLYRVDNLELANTQVSQFTTIYNLQFTIYNEGIYSNKPFWGRRIDIIFHIVLCIHWAENFKMRYP